MSVVGEISDLATAVGNKFRDLTITVSKLSDATTLTRTILQRTTGAQIRSDIGAGTSDLAIGTSGSTAMAGNKTAADLGGLQLGSTGSTAAAGNHTHSGYATATGSAVGVWLGTTASLPGTGTTGIIYFSY